MKKGTPGRLALPLLLVLAAGCDAKREPPPAVEDTVFDSQVEALDKAKDVERLTEEQAKKLRRAVEDAEGG